ncbi:MAG: hypothetical protein OEM28_03520 [Nitrosopumilus sp.]|nr:hypothetical protein [Nitrosopumilus sp.]MDH3488580.1 hypothetical protein [Nitrosopumilus sp.]
MDRIKKIKNIDNARFTIESIIKLYKKIPPDYNDAEDVLNSYDEAFNYIQKKFPKKDLSLYEIVVAGEYAIDDTPEEFEGFRKKLITKSEGLKDFLDSNRGKFDSEYKKIEERLDILEKEVKKFDERLNYATGELSTFHDMRKDLKEIVDFHRKRKKDTPKK